MDYKLMAIAVCNGKYTQYEIGRAIWLINHYGASEAESDAIKIWLEALGALDAQVRITVVT